MKFIFLILFSLTSVRCSALPAGGTKEIKASMILKKIDVGENVYLDNCIVWGDLDFTALKNRSKITPAIWQSYVVGSLTFDKCIFMGKVTTYGKSPVTTTYFARNLTFIHCDFRGEMDFSESIIEGNVFITGSVFHKTANWQGTYFKHKIAYFNEAKFEEDALFQNTVFVGDVNFMDVVFEKNAMFQKAKAGGLMMFGAVKFNGYADFSYVRAAESIFKYAKFKQRYDFSYSNMGELEIN